MSKIKCSVYNCRTSMSIDKHEVHSTRFFIHRTTDEEGKRLDKPFLQLEGNRFVCSYHSALFKKKKIRPTLDWVYGRKQREVRK